MLCKYADSFELALIPFHGVSSCWSHCTATDVSVPSVASDRVCCVMYIVCGILCYILLVQDKEDRYKYATGRQLEKARAAEREVARDLVPPVLAGTDTSRTEVILSGASVWAKVVDRCGAKDPARDGIVSKSVFGPDDPRGHTGFFGCALPATSARRASLHLRMTPVFMRRLREQARRRA